MDSEPGPLSGRRREIDTRLDAIRARLEELRERDWDADKSQTITSGERLEAAQRHAAESRDAAAQALTASAQAFGHAADMHERAASLHEMLAAAGTGDVRPHERQAALHRAGAASDRQRAEDAQSLLSQPGRAGPAAVCDEPGGDVAP